MNVKKIVCVILVLCLMICFTACGVVQSGETGVKVIDGVVQDETLKAGRYGYLGARTSVVLVNNKIQTYTYNDVIYGESDDHTVVLAEGVSITYSINPESSVWVVKNIPDFEDNIFPSAKISSAIKNAMANISTENVTNRSYIEPAAKQEVQSAIDSLYMPDVVNIIDVAIQQMDYEDSYNDAIAKISALKKQQEVEAIENQMKIDVAKAEAEAETTKAEAAKKIAEANAEAALIKAKSDAEIAKVNADSYAEVNAIESRSDANQIKLVSDSLSDEYIEYYKYQKWNGSLPTHTSGETYFNVNEDK